MSEYENNKEEYTIEILNEIENEDGSVTFEIQMSMPMLKRMAAIGVEKVLMDEAKKAIDAGSET